MTTFVRRLERRWLKDAELQALELEQVKAIIDALALTMYADFSSDDQEQGAFTSMMLSLPCGWADTAELSDYAEEAREAASKLSSNEELLAHAKEIAGRIPESVRRQAFEMSVALTIADRELTMGEAAVLSAFGEELGFDEASSIEIYEEILDALGLENH